MTPINTLAMSLGNLHFLSKAKTRSISPENFKGEKGKGGMATDGASVGSARDLGQGWKKSRHASGAGATVEIASIDGPGLIEQIWMTPSGTWRFCIIRIYWDDSENPAVECPAGDFVACGWGRTRP